MVVILFTSVFKLKFAFMKFFSIYSAGTFKT